MIEPVASETPTGKRGLPRFLAIVLVGPAVGTVVMLAVMLVLAPPFNEPDVWDALLRFSALAFLIGYLTGFAPSLLSALIWHFGISRTTRTLIRLIGVIATGALTGSLLVWPAMELVFGTYAPDAQFYLFSAGAGAFALLVTARPWRQGR